MAALGLLVPPDLYLRADSFSLHLQDSTFEANLKSNHMVWSRWGRLGPAGGHACVLYACSC